MDRLFTRPIARAMLWVGVGAAIGAVTVGGLWYARSGVLPDRSAITPGPPEILPPNPPPERGPSPEPSPPLPFAPPALPPAAPPPPPEAAVPAPPRPPRGAEPIGEFFGFPVESLEPATGQKVLPRVPPAGLPPPLPVAAPRPPVPVRLLAIPGKCVAGFDGTSTLHDFRGWTKSVSGWIEFEPGRMDRTAKAAFEVDARTLDTGDPDRDRLMHEEHLESSRFREMKFTLSEFHSEPGGSCTMKGALEIHGQSRAVEMAGTVQLRSDGVLHVKGQVKTKMSEFGITPPSKVLVIRTADEIGVWFEVWAAPRERSK